MTLRLSAVVLSLALAAPVRAERPALRLAERAHQRVDAVRSTLRDPVRRDRLLGFAGFTVTLAVAGNVAQGLLQHEGLDPTTAVFLSSAGISTAGHLVQHQLAKLAGRYIVEPPPKTGPALGVDALASGLLGVAGQAAINHLATFAPSLRQPTLNNVAGGALDVAGDAGLGKLPSSALSLGIERAAGLVALNRTLIDHGASAAMRGAALLRRTPLRLAAGPMYEKANRVRRRVRRTSDGS